MSGVSLAGVPGGVGGAATTGAVELCDSGGRSLKLQTDAPHLVSMGGDRLSTSVTLHPIPQGNERSLLFSFSVNSSPLP